MAEVTAKLFRDYFGGRWACKVFRNGEPVREVTVEWKGDHEHRAGVSSNTFWISPGLGTPDGPVQAAIAGWHSDIDAWCDRWYNEFGGYGELCWTSQGVVNGVKVLFGTVHECEKEGDDPADYIAMCELYDQDNFKYTIQSYTKGIFEVEGVRVRTPKKLAGQSDQNAAGITGNWPA